VEAFEVDALIDKRIAETVEPVADRVNQTLDKLQRTQSKAHLIGSPGGNSVRPDGTFVGGPTAESGAFLTAILDMAGNDPDAWRSAKATLEEISGARQEVPSYSKATLGTTDALGGWIVPNAQVDDIIKPSAERKNPYRNLMTWRSGIRGAAVDAPFRSATVSRAVIAAAGATKENRDLAYHGYAVTMYTLAAIYDLGNQFIRQSQGAAEQDVLSELAHAFALGEAHYIREGTGSSEPMGVIPALTNGPSEFRTTHTAAAATVAGAVASAIAKAGAALLGRGRTPEAAVMSASGFAEMLTNGADTAGFFLSGIAGPQSVPGLRPGTLVSPWGVPVFVDPNFASDDLVVAEWSAFKVYTGQSYRVDTSSEAGERFDKNLTGFRGEEELGFDARPAVYAGAAQLVTDILS
jgi:HK97 family phage major capsid protein